CLTRATRFPYTTLFRSGGEGIHQGRRHFPIRAVATLRNRIHRERAGPLPRLAPRESLALHVLPPLSRRIRPRRQFAGSPRQMSRSEEHTSELQSPDHLV